MKARITQMKAPWPSGAVVGQIVHFAAGVVPAWAVGKCEPAGEDAEADHLVGAPAEPQGRGDLEEFRAYAEKHIQGLEAEHRKEVDGLIGAIAERDARILALQNALNEAQKAKAEEPAGDIAEQAARERRQALEAEAKALGLDFHPNIGDAKLAAKVAEKKAAK